MLKQKCQWRKTRNSLLIFQKLNIKFSLLCEWKCDVAEHRNHRIKIYFGKLMYVLDLINKKIVSADYIIHIYSVILKRRDKRLFSLKYTSLFETLCFMDTINSHFFFFCLLIFVYTFNVIQLIGVIQTNLKSINEQPECHWLLTAMLLLLRNVF